jgi:hypothetical protein
MNPKIIFSFTFVAFSLLGSSCQPRSFPFTIPSSHPSFIQTAAIPPGDIPALVPSLSSHDSPFNISWDDRSLFRKRLTSSYRDILYRLPAASIYHLAFSFSDPPTSVNGVEEVRYTNQEIVDLTEVDFAIFSNILGGNIKINRVLLDGKPVIPVYRPGVMRVLLFSPLEPGQRVIFHIEFLITVPTLGEENYYGVFGYNDGILSLAHAYPAILVYNEHGWNNQTPDLDGDPFFSDISFYLVSIDAPANLTLVASGVEANRLGSPGRQHVLYADGPSRDFYVAASANFVKQSERKGNITFNCYATKGLADFSQSVIMTAEAAIDDFSRRYAPYPFTEFNIVPIAISASGVEFPGLTAISEKVYSQGNYLEVVVAHEVVHQWFYNLVGNETQMQPWLDESLAQFGTCQYFSDKYSAQAEQSCQNAMEANWDRLAEKDIPIGKPVSSYTREEYTSIVYGRGPFFFWALRQELGQAAFDSLMHDYATSFAWDIATTDGFKKLAEKHCNCSLTSLFQDWVYP